MAYPISDVTRRVVYTGSAGVGPYSFTFQVLANTDIQVYKNTTLLTLTTNYTVTINSNGTGSVTLVVAATGADTITIVGDRAIQRATDFVTGGDLFANTLNDEFDSLVIFAQQVDEKADRGLKAPVTDPTDVNMVLPLKANRSNKYLGFDSDGNPVAVAGTSSTPGTMGAQNSNDVTITGGTLSGVTITSITDLAVTDGGTGASTATNARTNLSAAKSGANSDITSITGLTTALTVAQGGTGLATLTANAVILGNGTSAVQAISPLTSGNVLTSNGTTWTSTAPASAGVTSVATGNGLSGGTITSTGTLTIAAPSLHSIGSYAVLYKSTNSRLFVSSTISGSNLFYVSACGINRAIPLPFINVTPDGNVINASSSFTAGSGSQTITLTNVAGTWMALGTTDVAFYDGCGNNTNFPPALYVRLS
jgi:hypothetical protein